MFAEPARSRRQLRALEYDRDSLVVSTKTLFFFHLSGFAGTQSPAFKARCGEMVFQW